MPSGGVHPISNMLSAKHIGDAPPVATPDSERLYLPEFQIETLPSLGLAGPATWPEVTEGPAGTHKPINKEHRADKGGHKALCNQFHTDYDKILLFQMAEGPSQDWGCGGQLAIFAFVLWPRVDAWLGW